MKRYAAILDRNQENDKEEWRIINDPTIGDISSLRQRGAVILRQVVERCGNIVHRKWITSSGQTVAYNTEVL